jgi:hypothetical protein
LALGVALDHRLDAIEEMQDALHPQAVESETKSKKLLRTGYLNPSAVYCVVVISISFLGALILVFP